jgi:hypothetical protein
LLNDQQLISDEVFEIKCYNFAKKRILTYQNLFVQFKNKYKQSIKVDKKNDEIPQCKPLNIMLISYDSVSRSSWLKRLPKTNKFIFDKMKFDLLNGYNIVGDGTPAALIPIFTGQTEEELPNVLRSNPKSRYVDEAYPFIWKELHDKGYMSMYLDDWPHISAFSYRMKGFLNHTCHHYYKHYQLKLWEIVSYDYFDAKGIKDDSCIGTKKRHKVLLDLLHDFKKEYKNLTNNIAIMHYVENSHDTNEKFNWVDNDLYTFLSKSYNDGLFDNTAIFLYSDHGLRFSDKRNNSNTRYLEERLPFFSVYLPNEYKLNNKDKYNNLKLNTKLLTSPFDIHATIRDLTCLPKHKTNEILFKNRSISLLDEINPNRQCDDIGISEHFCTCEKNWIKLNSKSNKVINSVEFTIDSINHISAKYRHLCMKLTLKEIISSESVLNKNYIELIKIQFVTSPNNGTYESIVYSKSIESFEFKSNTFSIRSKNDISRIDSYGEQPRCVSNLTSASNPNENLDLRKFCFCYKKRLRKKKLNATHVILY